MSLILSVPVLLPANDTAVFASEVVRKELSRLSRPASPPPVDDALRVVGLPAYLAQASTDRYLRRAREESGWLWARFGSLYCSVFAVLSDFFGRRIFVSAAAALPGFHVIRTTSRSPNYHGGVPHTDLPQLHVPVLAKLGPEAEQYSFTLLLSDEADDVGLEYWAPDVSVDKAIAVPPAGFLRYRRSHLAVLCSSLVHRIGAFAGPRERITFQGHLIRNGEHLIAYW